MLLFIGGVQRWPPNEPLRLPPELWLIPRLELLPELWLPPRLELPKELLRELEGAVDRLGVETLREELLGVKVRLGVELLRLTILLPRLPPKAPLLFEEGRVTVVRVLLSRTLSVWRLLLPLPWWMMPDPVPVVFPLPICLFCELPVRGALPLERWLMPPCPKERLPLALLLLVRLSMFRLPRP